jgi:short-subunit dehydrogenase
VTSSVVGEKATPGTGIYSATKHAVQGMMESLRGELRGTGVKAATVLPGAIATEW